MKPWIMFTKHLNGWSLEQVIAGIKAGGTQGADLCVRPDYPVNLENVGSALPEAVRQFADEGLTIPLVTAPTAMVAADASEAIALYEACAEACVSRVKIGYWHMDEHGYWPSVDRSRRDLEGFAKLSQRTAVKTLVHNHSGNTLGLNSSAMMHLVKGFDPRHVGVFADVGHLSIGGEPCDMAFDIVKEYLAAVALKDLVRQRTAKDGRIVWQTDVVPMGSGFGDFPLAVETLKQLAFEGPLSFHCEYGRLSPESIVDQCRIDTRYIESLMEGTK